MLCCLAFTCTTVNVAALVHVRPGIRAVCCRLPRLSSAHFAAPGCYQCVGFWRATTHVLIAERRDDEEWRDEGHDTLQNTVVQRVVILTRIEIVVSIF
jgi:hypothetical protein